MAITKTNRANFSSTTDATSFTSASFTPGATAILVVTVMNTKATTPDAVSTFSDTGNGYTWTSVHNVVDNASLRRITQYWALTGASPASMTLTADFGANTQTSCYIHCIEFAGLNTSAPTGNVNTQNPSASGTSLALTLSFSNAANGVYFVVGTSGVSSDTLTVSNGQSISTPSLSTPSTTMSVGWDSVNQTAPGWTWTNSRARLGAGFELVAAGGGRLARNGMGTLDGLGGQGQQRFNPTME